VSTCTLPPSRLSRRPPLRFQPAASPLPALTHVADFLAAFRKIAEHPQTGGKLETMGEVTDRGASAGGDQCVSAGGDQCGRLGTDHPLFAWTRRVPARLSYGTPSTGPQQEARQIKKPEAPKIYLSAGIHGDEPAGPLALLELLAEGFFDDRAHWFMCPVLNPLGFIKGTRENADGTDLNRDYHARHSAEVRAHIAWLQSQPTFDLTLCLHEDWESTGFYLYEHNLKHRPSLAPALLNAVRPHMPIERAHIIDGRPIDEPGILRPEINAQDRDDWPEQLYLREHFHYDLGYTMETPSSLPLAPRIDAQKALVATAVERLLKEFHAET